MSLHHAVYLDFVIEAINTFSGQRNVSKVAALNKHYPLLMSLEAKRLDKQQHSKTCPERHLKGFLQRMITERKYNITYEGSTRP